MIYDMLQGMHANSKYMFFYKYVHFLKKKDIAFSSLNMFEL